MTVPLHAQNERTGAIEGEVVAANGAPLAGTTVELASAAGAVVRRTTTDVRGEFRFVLLAPGTYQVTARQIGYRGVTRAEVRVVAGEQTLISLALEVAPVELDSVQVTASRVQIDRVTTEFGTELDAREIELLPVTHDPKDLVAFTPGARPGQVWGGATVQANNYQLDGLAANHPGVGGDFIEPSISWIESVEVKGLGAGAEYGNFQGGLINVTTKSGSNRFQGAVRSSAESHHLNAGNLGEWDIGSEVTARYDLEGEVRGPLVRDRLFYFVAGHWIHRDARHISHLQPFEDQFLPAPEERREGRVFGKLTWTPTRRNRLDLAGGGIDTRVERWGMSGFEAPEATLRMTAPARFFSGAWRHELGERSSVEARVAGFDRDEERSPYADPTTPSVQLYGLRPPYAVYQNAPIRFRHAPRSTSAALALDLGLRTAGAEHRLKAGVERTTGSFVDERLRTTGMTWRPPRLPSFEPADPQSWMFSTVPFIPSTWGGEVRLHADVENSALYLQDYITLGPRLHLNPGVRFGRWRGWLTPDGGTGRHFLAVEDAAWEPRIGVTVDVTGKGDLVAKAHWGRYHQNMLAQLYDRVEGGNVFSNEQLWYYYGSLASPRTAFSAEERDRLARDGIFALQEEIVLNETGPAENYRQPYVDQWVAGVEKAIGDWVKVEAVYVHRRNRDMVALVDRNRATNYAVYEHVRVFNAFGEALAYNGSPLLLNKLYVPNDALVYLLNNCGGIGQPPCPPGVTRADIPRLTWDPDYVLTNALDARREFDQVQLALQAAFPRWGASASVVFTRLRGNRNNVTGYDDPAGFGAGPYVRVNEDINSFGALENSSDRELKLAVWGNLPGGVRGGAFWNYALGDHYSPQFTLSGLQYQYMTFDRKPLASLLVYPLAGHNVFVGPRGRLKHDPRASVDFRLEREFRVQRLEWAVTLDVFNLFNFATVTDVNTSVNLGKNFYHFLPPGMGGTQGLDPSGYFEAVRGRVPPRTLRLGTAIRF